MRLLVTGAGGMLGSDVTETARKRGHDVAALARADLDVLDPDAVHARLRAERPDAVVHCAAFTDVDGAETAEAEAHRLNGESVRTVGRSAAGLGTRVLLPSTDYVFDGTGRRPYVETDETGPRSAYGRSKLAGEVELRAAGEQHAVVRTSWLFGRHGPNFVDTMLRLGREREEVRVVDDQVGCPTFTGHLAEGLVRLAEDGTGGTCHMAATGSCSWFAFAQAIFAATEVECRVVPTTSAELGLSAPRPAYSVLATGRADVPTLPPWQEGLAEHLAIRMAA